MLFFHVKDLIAAFVPEQVRRQLWKFYRFCAMIHCCFLSCFGCLSGTHCYTLFDATFIIDAISIGLIK